MTHSLNPKQNQKDLLNFFQHYAAEALRKQNQEAIESLKRRQIGVEKLTTLEETYKIDLDSSCTIPDQKIQEAILQQIDAVAHFIKYFHVSVLGQRNTLFHIHEIVILIDKSLQSSFEFDSGKLFIKISYWEIKFFKRYFSYQNLKNLWSRGVHLDKASPLFKSWWLFNPVGELRSNFRAMLLLAIENKILEIDNLLTDLGRPDASHSKSLDFKPETGETNKLRGSQVPTKVHRAIIDFLKATVNEEKLGVNLEQVLENKDEDTLINLLTLFKKNLADPTQIEEILNAGVLTLKEVIQKEQSQVNIKMFGFVNVGNYHRIDVAVNLSSGYLKRYIEVIPRKADIKAILFGFVNVYTIDDITVKPNFHGGMKLNFETVALDRALKELQMRI